MSHTPLISIGLPVYNACKTLKASLRSIQQQTYTQWELWVMDDGSTDQPEKIIEELSDSRIHHIRGTDNRGISERLNQAISLSQGKYFARMDADDIAFPKRFAAQVAFLELHPEVDLVGSSILQFHGAGIVEGVLPNPAICTHQEICRRPWSGIPIAHPTMMGKRDWFARHKYCSEFNGAEDQHLLYRTYRSSKFACLPEPLLGYRWDPPSFEKVFHRRCVFLRAFLGEAWRSQRYQDAVGVIGLQSAKIVADVLRIYMGFGNLKHKMHPVEDALLAEWKNIWTHVHNL